MTDLDKVLFTFASYNAGPARVARLREEAIKRGLDPNIWFHNVEYIAADRIGAERVPPFNQSPENKSPQCSSAEGFCE